MLIKEEDIFKYVFYSGELDPSVKDYIEKNIKSFESQIKICRSVYSGLSNEEEGIINNVSREIMSRLNTIELVPVKKRKSPVNKTITLAAATSEVALKQSEDLTFTDQNSKYLVRLISGQGRNMLYFFAKGIEDDRKIKLTLVPSNDIYHIKGSSQQIDLNTEKLIDKIIIEEE